MSALSPRLMQAMNTAAVSHRDHVRKGSGIPYIAHLYAVMHLVSQVTEDEDVLIAALLHDTLEDVPDIYPETRMRAEFGGRVTDIVLGLTKDDSLPDWQARADAYLQHLAQHAPDESVLIACADKLHNLCRSSTTTLFWVRPCGSASTPAKNSSSGGTARSRGSSRSDCPDCPSTANCRDWSKTSRACDTGHM